MRKLFTIVAVAALSGCSAATVPATPAPPPTPGASPLDIYTYCQSEAFRQQPGITIRAESFRHAFIKACMVDSGVDPAYIIVLLDG